MSSVTVTDHILDPLIRLALRIDEQWPSTGILNDHAILDTQIIARKTVDLPATHSDGVAERVN